ncbi:MAG: WG repeat-containing protein, partial [Muribaculaceae bacterium]|nr:WG repeat-containing protein [Muribaculaceae bacterium]
VMTIDGKVVVKPEYDGINFIGDDYIAVMKNGDESNDYQQTFRLLDNNGQPFTHTVFTAIAGNTNYRGFEGKDVFACEGEHDWIIFDEKGAKLPGLPKIYDLLPYSSGDMELRTDKVNYTKLFNEIKIGPSYFGGYNFSMGPRAALEEQQKQWSMDGAEQSRPKASDYSWMQDIYVYGDVDGLSYSGEVHFPQTLSKQTYRQEKIIDYTWGNYYWYHLENIPAGYVFNNITPSYFKLTFNHWTFYGKLRDLYKALVEYCKKWGTVEDSNNAATLINLENGKKMLIAMTPDEVMIKWGKLPQDDTWIGTYANNSEKLESTYDGNIYFATMVNNYYSSGDVEEEGD